MVFKTIKIVIWIRRNYIKFFKYFYYNIVILIALIFVFYIRLIKNFEIGRFFYYNIKNVKKFIWIYCFLFNYIFITNNLRPF